MHSPRVLECWTLNHMCRAYWIEMKSKIYIGMHTIGFSSGRHDRCCSRRRLWSSVQEEEEEERSKRIHIYVTIGRTRISWCRTIRLWYLDTCQFIALFLIAVHKTAVNILSYYGVALARSIFSCSLYNTTAMVRPMTNWSVPIFPIANVVLHTQPNMYMFSIQVKAPGWFFGFVSSGLVELIGWNSMA